MRKRLLSLFTSLFMAISMVGILPVMTASAAGITLAAAKQQYPSGSRWTGSYDGASQCHGWALMIADKIYGFSSSSSSRCRCWTRHKNINNIKAGDVVVIYRSSAHSTNKTHTVFVTAVNGNNFTFADCNWDWKGGIRWDVTKSKSELTNNSWGYGVEYISSAPYELEVEQKPSAPTNVVITTNNGKLSISWTAVSNATSYVVYAYTNSKCSEYAYKKELKTTSVSGISLSAGRYWIYVHAINSAGQSGSGPFNYLTEPRNLKVQLNNGVFDLKWDSVPGANCYDVIMTKPDGTQEWLHTNSNEKKINNCVPGNYKFEVQSLYRENGSTTNQVVGAHSNAVSYYYGLTAPQNVKVITKNKNYLYVTWDKVTGASCYDIIITKPNGETDYLHTHTTDKTIDINNNFGNYKISVQAIFRVNESKTNQIVSNRSSEVLFDYQKAANTAELKYQLRQNDDSTDVRFILVADEQEVINADCASVYATIDDYGDTDSIVIKRAYRSIKAGGKTITADEGKVFLIGKFIGIPDDMINGMVGHFTLGENTYERTITH